MAAGLSACNEKEVVKPVGGEAARAVIVNSPDGAQDGEIMVKFRPEVSGLLSRSSRQPLPVPCRLHILYFSNRILHSFTASAAVTPFSAYFLWIRWLPAPASANADRSQTLSTPVVFATNEDGVKSPFTHCNSSAVNTV